MKVLFDTNVVLDVLAERKPFVNEAISLFELVESGEIVGVIGATSVTTLDYILSKSLTTKASASALKNLLKLFEVAPVNRLVLEEALDSGFHDFEDAVLHSAGIHVGAQAIITRDDKGFKKSQIAVYTPSQFYHAYTLN